MSIANNTPACPSNTTGQANIIFVGVYSVIFIVGLIFNLIALIVFFRHTKSRSHTTVYMTNLAVADLLLVLTLPMRIYHHLGLTGLPQLLCDWLGLILLANMYGSIFLLTCICFDRCMAVTFPMSPRVKEGRKKAPLVCFGVWILTFGASLPVYFTKGQNTPQEYFACFKGVPMYTTRAVAVFSTLSVGFGIPLMVMLICSWGLVRAVQQSTVAHTELVDNRKIQRMIAASLLIFLLSFLPYHTTLGLLYMHGRPVSCPLLSAYQYSLMVACLNAVLDPIVYYFTTETFRRNVDMDVVRKMVPLNSHSSTEGNNKPRGPINT